MSDSLNIFSLEGRVAIVTGASRGIGLAIAEGLVNAGAIVYGLGRTAVYANNDSKVEYIQCDVTNAKQFNDIVESIHKKHQQIHILVNAAGITMPARSEQTPSDTFLQTITTNLTAVYECCRIVSPFMQASQYGSIINVTSIGSLQGFPGNPGYIASKGGLASLTRALAVDYGSKGIRVNNLVPGYIRTQMTEASYQDPAKNQARASRTLLGRWGESTELIGAAIFLASSASSYVTGTDLIVDGGWIVKGL
ncbi:SDR family oxidoreductase [Methylophilus methylotrophus]|uniref:SDR family oxidoreductase n=1 Tax=Methylophilus methylotrophus TaxID=17 RepID=UPI000F5A53FC|nr:SDR family oxidoreductase [Methylophilus methylotrophus]